MGRWHVLRQRVPLCDWWSVFPCFQMVFAACCTAAISTGWGPEVVPGTHCSQALHKERNLLSLVWFPKDLSLQALSLCSYLVCLIDVPWRTITFAFETEMRWWMVILSISLQHPHSLAPVDVLVLASGVQFLTWLRRPISKCSKQEEVDKFEHSAHQTGQRSLK